MRYIKQRDKFRCGPVALLNALKWKGENLTGSDLPTISNICNCDSYWGTRRKYFSIALRKLGIRYTYQTHPSLQQLQQHLKEGSFIINYSRYGCRHLAFVPEFSNGCFALTNVWDQSLVRVRPQTFENHMMRKIDAWKKYPAVWLIKDKK